MAISFGTSGHRGIIGKEFTVLHVEAIAQAVADYVLSKCDKPTVALGYDPRTGNDPQLKQNSFTQAAVSVFLANGVSVDCFDSFTPTPLVSWYIEHKKISGGVILTASHNPPEYNGMKFNPENGAPAPTAVTKQIEQLANRYFESPDTIKTAPARASLTRIRAVEPFVTWLLAQLSRIFGTFDLSQMPFAVDAKHGTAAEAWVEIFKQLGVKQFQILNDRPLADFAGVQTNPTLDSALNDLRKLQKTLQAQLAIANDPDADRHAILDETGSLLLPEETTAIILDYMIQKKIPVYGAATTIASSRLIQSVISAHHLKSAETAVGFKYFAPFLQEARDKNMLTIAVESSGGFTGSWHTLEKCGFLPGLLIGLIMQQTGQPLSALRRQISARYGANAFLETVYHYQAEQKQQLASFCKAPDTALLDKTFGQKIQNLITIDGLKIVFSNNDWVLFRLSGTEPIVRIYAETATTVDSQHLINGAQKLLNRVIGNEK